MHRTDMPLVTIVVSVYNKAEFIERTIASVVEQSFAHLEILIIDDASVDESCEIIREISAREQRIRLIQLQKNSGVCAARNLGISEAKGEYVLLLDGDDLLSPHAVTALVNQFKEYILSLIHI